MTEQKFESKFHRWYVGGKGEVEERPAPAPIDSSIRPRTLEDILAEYRSYVGDPNAELPEEIMAELRILGKA